MIHIHIREVQIVTVFPKSIPYLPKRGRSDKGIYDREEKPFLTDSEIPTTSDKMKKFLFSVLVDIIDTKAKNQTQYKYVGVIISGVIS